ncbi:hypothetical protein H6G33_22320 [Calothrix sp. FACHB-1219]|uniref:hypothetical protein n=1 Tax=unclassified Calothrix TaxID=2619626 RepID=UPI001685195D|nr:MULTISPECIES: hypothetical protein [unclassified Calothrix]MBD2200966.1 hypothetical protein [Calothrix sp. FACHB-168]MBD2219756.1 hypothetical protein [Calothrix sp. FACHB-1219]
MKLNYNFCIYVGWRNENTGNGCHQRRDNPCLYSQQSTVNSQQSTVNSQQSTYNPIPFRSEMSLTR